MTFNITSIEASQQGPIIEILVEAFAHEWREVDLIDEEEALYYAKEEAEACLFAFEARSVLQYIFAATPVEEVRLCVQDDEEDPRKECLVMDILVTKKWSKWYTVDFERDVRHNMPPDDVKNFLGRDLENFYTAAQKLKTSVERTGTIQEGNFLPFDKKVTVHGRNLKIVFKQYNKPFALIESLLLKEKMDNSYNNEERKNAPKRVM